MPEYEAREHPSADVRAKEASDDFGHVVQHRARAVVRPLDEAGIVSTVAAARRERVAIVARGTGHSVFGQSQIRDGWIMDMTAIEDVVIDGDVAIVGAGARWADVLRASLHHGKAPPVLTDYIGLSVGGTLSVGGVGGGSFRHGMQTDNVLSLRVVTGQGEARECSTSQERALFDVVRGGLGQVAVIVQATLRLIDVPDCIRHYRIIHSSLHDVLSDLDLLVRNSRFDQLSAVGTISGDGTWHFHIDATLQFRRDDPPHDSTLFGGMKARSRDVEVTDLSALDYGLRLSAEVDAWRSSGLWDAPHPWVDVLVPDEALPAFASSVVGSLDPESLGVEGAMILIYPIDGRAARTPLLPAPSGRAHAYLFDVLRCIPGASTSRIHELLEQNRRIYESALAAGGSLYPISAVRMSTEDWRHHFGREWSSLIAAKQRFDPDGVLGCECGIFPRSSAGSTI